MSLCSLPSITENQFSNYIRNNFTGSYTKTTPDGNVEASYTVYKAFSVSPFTIPGIIVAAGKFKEVEPWTHVYEGELSVAIVTQVDDCTDPIAIHDSAVAQVYDILSNQTGLYAGVAGDNFHLWNYYSTNYDQALAGAEGERTINSVIDFKINCQTLPVDN